MLPGQKQFSLHHARMKMFRTAALGMLASVWLPGFAVGQTDPDTVAGFEIHGRLYSGSAPAPFDLGGGWAQGEAFLGVLDDDGNTVGAFNAQRQLDENWGNQGDAVDPTMFEGSSNKNDDLIGSGQNPWDWGGGGGGPRKNDLTNTYFHSRMDPDTGHLWVFIGAETRSTGGDSHVDFEFNQAGVEQVGTTSGQLIGNGPLGGRTLDDFIVSIDFQNGGGSPGTTFRAWNGNAFVEMPASGKVVSATNSSNIAHGSGGVWKHFAANGGTVEVLSALQLVEAGIDLTALGVAVDVCSTAATFTVKSRSSTSFTSTLKDFVLVEFSLVPPPEASATNDGPVCEVGGDVQLFAGPDGMSYSWTGPEGFASTAQNPVVSPAAAGEYCVTVTNTGGCSDDACTTVEVTALSEATATNDGPVCSGEDVQLSAGPDGQSYSWISPDGFSSDQQNPVVSPAIPDDYCVTVTDPLDCSQSACTTVVLNLNPDCFIEGPETVCNGSTCNVFGAGGTAFALSDSAFGSSPPVEFNWSISGDAEIRGPTNGSAVSVGANVGAANARAGAVNARGGAENAKAGAVNGDIIGSFTLFLTTTSAEGCTSDCSLTVGIEDCDESEITVCEGCSHGFWKQTQHFPDWTPPYDPIDLFDETGSEDLLFEDAFRVPKPRPGLITLGGPPGLTLQEVLRLGGGGLNSLGRETVAALLNAASPNVNYTLSVDAVITMFNDVFPGGDLEYSELQNIFEEFNHEGCPLGGS